MVWEDELSERKMRILKTLIDDYIQTAQPVGSRTISKKHELGLSSATIRNEMADLEEMGYITQPHTSAGRVPSDKGYRFYVDHLIQVETLARDEIKKIRSAIELRLNEIDALINRASDIVSTITGYTSFALTPMLTKTVLRTVQVVQVDEKRVLVIIVTGGGVVKNSIVRLNTECTADNMMRLSSFLEEKLSGKIIENIQIPSADFISREIKVDPGIVECVLEGLNVCLKGTEQSDLMLHGTTNLLNHPEFSDLLKVKEVLELLSDKDIIKALISSTMIKSGLQVQIGKENQLGLMQDCSLVTTAYGVGNTDVGAFGILGPTRMSYAKVISAMKYIQKLINRESLRILSEE
ncbi:MAG TPA: heat-inducible transcriptional repressor HrcA [Clostridia bacterium]